MSNTFMKKPIPPYKKTAKIPIIESNEKIVDLLSLSSKIISGMTNRRLKLQNLDKPRLFARKSVAFKLIKALTILHNQKGNQFGFMIFDAHRPNQVQRKWFLAELDRCQKENPQLSLTQCTNQVKRWLSPGRIKSADSPPPHSTGGAIDLTVAQWNNRKITPLNMGSKYGEWTPKSWAWNQAISSSAKKNRCLLFSLMKKVGLVNYEGEWWHFSFGDRFWAVKTNHAHAIFGEIKPNNIFID